MDLTAATTAALDATPPNERSGAADAETARHVDSCAVRFENIARSMQLRGEVVALTFVAVAEELLLERGVREPQPSALVSL